jgi:hypothetical protein
MKKVAEKWADFVMDVGEPRICPEGLTAKNPRDGETIPG